MADSPWTPEVVAEVRLAWEESDETAEEIGRRLGTSKDAIIGLARRQGWLERCALTRLQLTLHDRMDALHEELDLVLRENPVLREPVALLTEKQLAAREKMRQAQARRTRERHL